jgi:hypothetical protein
MKMFEKWTMFPLAAAVSLEKTCGTQGMRLRQMMRFQNALFSAYKHLKPIQRAGTTLDND